MTQPQHAIQKAMLKRPAELAKEVMATDSNEGIRGLILLKNNQWLKLCKCPATTDTYKKLNREWYSSTPVANNESEREILKHRDDSSEKLSKFAVDFRKRCGLKEEETSLEAEAPFIFLDDMIKRKQSEEASSVIACLKNLASLLNCTSR